MTDAAFGKPPKVYAALGVVRRALARLWRQKVLLLPAFGLAGCLVAVGFLVSDKAWRYGLWVGAAFLLLAFAIIQVAIYALQAARRQAAIAGHLQELARRLAEIEHTVAGTSSAHVKRIETLQACLTLLASELTARIDLASETTEAAESRLGTGQETIRREVDAGLASAKERVESQLRDIRGAVAAAKREATESWELARASTRIVRAEVDRLSAAVDTAEPPPPVPAVVTGDPLLTIAIPAYGRLEALEQCLQSVVAEVEASGLSDVEVWVIDDRSPDPRVPEAAHRYATEHSFVGYRSNEENLGLERNLLHALGPSRGAFVWVLGVDDFLHPGALEVVYADVAAGDHDVLLYAKTRVDRTGTRQLPTTPGAMPDLGPGEQRHYDAVLAVAAETGIISGLGFISTLIVRRECLVGASDDPYLGLTMYPQLGVLLETSSFVPALVRSHPVVNHRTQTPVEKLAEAIGRREEGFMAGGSERNERWFGASYAAMLQRVIDRSDLTHDDLRALPEHLLHVDNMVDWMRRNRDAGDASGLQLPPDVVADADRFFDGVTASDDRRAAEPDQSDDT